MLLFTDYEHSKKLNKCQEIPKAIAGSPHTLYVVSRLLKFLTDFNILNS
jgi:hypothetical protein